MAAAGDALTDSAVKQSGSHASCHSDLPSKFPVAAQYRPRSRFYFE